MENLSKKQRIIVYVMGIIVFVLVGLYIWKRTENVNYESIEEEVSNDTFKTEENISKTEETDEDIIIIHVIGAIKNPGIVRIKQGARIIDVVEAAGGCTEIANLDRVNLAYIVEDGQKICIPEAGEKEEEAIEGETEELYITENAGNNIIMENIENQTSQKININTATNQELQVLSGIGEATAQNIIEYRETNGKFESIEEIKDVKGIGEARYNNIKEYICIK